MDTEITISAHKAAYSLKAKLALEFFKAKETKGIYGSVTDF